MVAAFLRQGLVADEPAIVVATSSRRSDILKELTALSFDTARLERHGDLLLLDADETISRFMQGDTPDAARFTAIVTNAIERACRGRRGCTVRVYGELVDVLWKEGKHEAAVRVEVLWNQSAGTHDFSLLCGYSMGNFYKDANVQDICRQHSHVTSTAAEAGLVQTGTGQPT